MKYKTTLLVIALATGIGNAATITVSPGAEFLGQGLTVTTEPFAVAVGNFSGGLWTQFGDAIVDTGTVNGVFTAQAPTSLNNELVHVFVGNGTNFEDSTSYIILASTAGTTFPPDVTAAGGTTFNAALGSGVTTVFATPDASISGNGLTIAPIPEPSAALLGALGALGLLRRRRI